MVSEAEDREGGMGAGYDRQKKGVVLCYSEAGSFLMKGGMVC